MKKTLILLLSLLFITTSAYGAVGKETKGPFGYNLYDDITRKPDTAATEKKSKSSKAETAPTKEYYGDDNKPDWESERIYYPDASLSSAIKKYQTGNYSGCLQEMISLTKIDPSNPVIYYYMGMAYTQVGNKDQAVKAYETVMKLNSDETLKTYARKGRDCLVGGPTCIADTVADTAEDEIENLLNSPDVNGFSEELNKQVKEQQLKDIQKTINKKEHLEEKDIEKIQKFDEKSKAPVDNKIAENVSEQDILSALETLKQAGLTISVNPYQQAMPVNNQINELSLLLGGNNNNNNSMMNMLPYMISQNQNGQNIDPQVFQAMMMNSLLPDFTFGDKNNKY